MIFIRIKCMKFYFVNILHNLDSLLQKFRCYSVVGLLTSIVPKDKNIWIWTSYPLYSDAPLIFYRYCKERYPEVRHIWIGTRGSVLGNTEFESYDILSFKGMYFTLRGKVIFTNNNEFFRLKGQNQILIDFWHGIPIKSILNYDRKLNGNLKTFAYRVDFRISPSRFVTALFSSAFGDSPSKYIEDVYIRNDHLLNVSGTSAREMMEISIDSKVALYVPTYRNGYRNKNDGNVDHFQGDVLSLMEKSLHAKGFDLIVKPHPFEENNYDSSKRIVKSRDLVSKSLTMSDLLASVDLLITDYSSLLIDFLVTGKPLIVFSLDEGVYKNNRGYTFDVSSFFIDVTAKNIEELIELINSLDPDSFRYREILTKLYFDDTVHQSNSINLANLLHEKRPDIF